MKKNLLIAMFLLGFATGIFGMEAKKNKEIDQDINKRYQKIKKLYMARELQHEAVKILCDNYPKNFVSRRVESLLKKEQLKENQLESLSKKMRLIKIKLDKLSVNKKLNNIKEKIALLQAEGENNFHFARQWRNFLIYRESLKLESKFAWMQIKKKSIDDEQCQLFMGNKSGILRMSSVVRDDNEIIVPGLFDSLIHITNLRKEDEKNTGLNNQRDLIISDIIGLNYQENYFSENKNIDKEIVKNSLLCSLGVINGCLQQDDNNVCLIEKKELIEFKLKQFENLDFLQKQYKEYQHQKNRPNVRE